ncbi:MAG: hypothetical protein E5X59_00890 [Mesorhizobium sp.]|nr:MAG: hypothetical protein E5X59_00890 [Mesorhizobium sp.]
MAPKALPKSVHAAVAADKSAPPQTKPSVGRLRDRITELEHQLYHAEQMRDEAERRGNYYLNQVCDVEAALKTVSRMLAEAVRQNRQLEESQRRQSTARDFDDDIPF